MKAGVAGPVKRGSSAYSSHQIKKEAGACLPLADPAHLSQWGKPYIEVADLCNLAVHKQGAFDGQR